MAAKIAIMATTIINSMSVKPWVLRMLVIFDSFIRLSVSRRGISTVTYMQISGHILADPLFVLAFLYKFCELFRVSVPVVDKKRHFLAVE